MRSIRCCVWVQVPVIAKADSMTLEELRQFRKYVRSELEQVLPCVLDGATNSALFPLTHEAPLTCYPCCSMPLNLS